VRASNTEAGGDVRFAAEVRDVPDRFLDVLSVEVLVQSERRERVVTEVCNADARRVASNVKVTDDGDEKLTNSLNAFRLNTSRHVHDEYQINVTRTRYTRMQTDRQTDRQTDNNTLHVLDSARHRLHFTSSLRST